MQFGDTLKITHDFSGAFSAVCHGAGVSPSLSVGCSFHVPALQRTDHSAASARVGSVFWYQCELEKENFASWNVTISSMLLAVGWTLLLRALCLFTISLFSEEETKMDPLKKVYIKTWVEVEHMQMLRKLKLCITHHRSVQKRGQHRWTHISRHKT